MFSNLIKEIRAIIAEAKKLKFPKKTETLFYLMVVVLMAIFCSIMFFIIDSISFKFIKKLIAFLCGW